MKIFVSMVASFALCAAITPMLEVRAAEIAGSAEAAKPLKAGETAPPVSLRDGTGKVVPLSQFYRKKPLVVVFFRGGWCPICTRHTQELSKAYSKLKEQGVELIGISPDSTENSKKNVDDNLIPFPILSDSKVAATQAFGLAFKVDDTTVKRYKELGLDLELASGQQHHALPVPAVFIVNTDGKIVYAHSNPDYGKRLSIKNIFKAIEAL